MCSGVNDAVYPDQLAGQCVETHMFVCQTNHKFIEKIMEFWKEKMLLKQGLI